MKQVKMREGKLLNEDGNLYEPGYAFRLLKVYDRKAIKAPKSRIKEWDYYFFHDDEYGVALTIDDNSYMGLISFSIIDFKNKGQITKSVIRWFTNGKTNLPSTSKTGDVVVRKKNYEFAFYNNNGKRKINCTYYDKKENKTFQVGVILNETTPHSMVIATPFDKDRHFYYNQKINLLKVEGSFSYGDINHVFKDDCYGVLDWGRGVWTYKNTWYWSSLSVCQNDHRIGFNLGYGFGNTKDATENVLFVDDKVYKLDDVRFEIPTDSEGKDIYLDKWKIVSESKDIDLEFNPIIDRYSNTNALIIQSKQHQVFGYFTGTFKVGKETYKLDNALGFAEKVYNRW